MAGRIWGILLAGLGVVAYFYAGHFPTLEGGYPGPALFPRLIAGGLALSGAILAWRPGTTPKANSSFRSSQTLGAAVLILLTALIPFVWTWLGPGVALGVLAAATAWLSGVPLWHALLLGAATGAGLYLLFFNLLGVPI